MVRVDLPGAIKQTVYGLRFRTGRPMSSNTTLNWQLSGNLFWKKMTTSVCSYNRTWWYD